jgi:hypothetical protein
MPILRWATIRWRSSGTLRERNLQLVPCISISVDLVPPSVSDYFLIFRICISYVFTVSGLQSFDYHPYLQTQIGEDWDVVSWDPRAVGKSEPKLIFFHNLTEENDFWGPMTRPGGVFSLPPLWSQESIDKLYVCSIFSLILITYFDFSV